MVKVNKNDVMAFTSFVKVEEVVPHKDYGTVIKVFDLDNNNEFLIRGQDLVDAGKSADSFSETKKVTKTQMAEILVSSFNVPFTVEFLTDKKEKRVVRGRLLKPEPLMGRSLVDDFDNEKKCQVNHRELKSLVVNGTKYVVK